MVRCTLCRYTSDVITFSSAVLDSNRKPNSII